MSYTCEKCGKEFKTLGYLNRHINSKTCIESVLTIYKCKKCGKESEYKKDIIKHQNSCQSITNNYSEVENLKKIISIYENIIEQHLKIKLNVTSDNSVINIVSKSTKDVKFINNHINEKQVKDNKIYHKVEKSTKTVKVVSKHKKKKRSRYRHIKNEVNLKEETDSNTFEHLNKEIEDEFLKDKNILEIWNLNKEECINNIQTNLDLLRVSKQYNKNLLQIKNNRMKLLRFLNIRDFKKFIIENIENIKSQFKQRGSDDKKFKKLLKHKILNPFEFRMLGWSGFENTDLTLDHINFVKNCVKVKDFGVKKFVPFIISKITTELNSYYLSICTIKEILQIILLNNYKHFPNIIYLKLNKSDQDDPFSFYYIENITEKNRNWRMDSRLEELCTDLKVELLKFCVGNFRKIYRNIYNDNDYRENFENNSQVFDYEGIILLQNIIYLSNEFIFIKDVQNLIIENSTYTPTVKDRFNLFSDDGIQKRKFKEMKNNNFEQDTIDNLKLLFDTINDIQIIDFYKKIKNDINT